MSAAPSEVAVSVIFPAAGPAGGVERVVAELLRFQSTRRPTQFVGTTIAEGVVDPSHPVRHRPVRPLPSPRSMRPVAFRRAADRVLSAMPPSLTVSCGVQAPPGDVQWVHSVHAAWLDRGTPAIVRGRSVPAWARALLPRHRVLLALERDYFSSTAERVVLCTSTQEVDDLAHFYKVPRELMHVVPNGFDPLVFNPARRHQLRQAARHRLGMREEDISVLLVANEWHRKGLGPLLEAVAAVSDPRIRIDLVGRLPPTGYTELASHLGLSERTHWHGSAKEIAPFYAAADVFALPTTYEPFGIVIVEAMAMGLPVVVSRLAGAAESICDRRDGILLDDPRDVDSLADALGMLTAADVRASLGRAATEAVAHLTWDQVLATADDLMFRARAGG